MEQGTRSYTFHPPLRCKNDPALDERHVNDVMKVPNYGVDDLQDFRNEIDYSRVIRNLDPDQRYFLPLSEDFCEIDPAVAREELGDDNTLRTGYFLPYGGISFERAMKNATVADAWNWLRHLLEAIALLEDANINHNDLHSSNIVVDSTGRLPRIIDFGNMSDIQTNAATDVYFLLLNYGDALPLLQRRFPGSESLRILDYLIEEQSNRTPTLLASELLPLVEETISSLV